MINGPVQPVRKRMPVAGKVALGCTGGCFLLLALIVVAIVVGVMHARPSVSAARAVGDRFVDAVAHNNTDQAYALVCQRWKTELGKAGVKDLFNLRDQLVGKIKSTQYVTWNWFTGTGGQTVTLVYSVHGARREGTLTVLLISEGGAMRVQRCNIDAQGPARR